MFVRAAQELGLRYNPDFNGASQDGVGYYDVTQRKARRESAATAYLRPARGRRNLTIVPHALGTKVIVENGRAIGLEYTVKGKPTKAFADAELANGRAPRRSLDGLLILEACGRYRIFLAHQSTSASPQVMAASVLKRLLQVEYLAIKVRSTPLALAAGAQPKGRRVKIFRLQVRHPSADHYSSGVGSCRE